MSETKDDCTDVAHRWDVTSRTVTPSDLTSGTYDAYVSQAMDHVLDVVEGLAKRLGRPEFALDVLTSSLSTHCASRGISSQDYNKILDQMKPGFADGAAEVEAVNNGGSRA